MGENGTCCRDRQAEIWRSHEKISGIPGDLKALTKLFKEVNQKCCFYRLYGSKKWKRCWRKAARRALAQVLFYRQGSWAPRPGHPCPDLTGSPTLGQVSARGGGAKPGGRTQQNKSCSEIHHLSWLGCLLRSFVCSQTFRAVWSKFLTQLMCRFCVMAAAPSAGFACCASGTPALELCQALPSCRAHLRPGVWC